MKTLFNSLYYLLIALICSVGLLVLASIVPIPGQIAVKVVKSGSMEPSIPVGSVVVDRPAASYAVGDVITFGKDTKTQIPTTHRVVGISGSGADMTFTVKGDSNNAADPTVVKLSDIHGKVIFAIPYLGYILAFAKTRIGFIFLIVIPALFVCVEEAVKIVAEVQHMRRRPSRKSQKRARVALTRAQVVPRRRVLISPHVIDLRRVVYVDRPPEEPPDREVRQRNGIHFGPRALGTALVAILVVSAAVVSRSSGDTAAYYMSTQVATGNSLTARADFGTDGLVTEAAVAPLSLEADSALLILDVSDPSTDPPADDVSAADETPPDTNTENPATDQEASPDTDVQSDPATPDTLSSDASPSPDASPAPEAGTTQ